jgi:hypothetical protein
MFFLSKNKNFLSHLFKNSRFFIFGVLKLTKLIFKTPENAHVKRCLKKIVLKNKKIYLGLTNFSHGTLLYIIVY